MAPGSVTTPSGAIAESPPGVWRGTLRHKYFRYVWFGSMGSNTGTWMEGVGVQWLMATQTASALMMGYLAVAQLGPILLLGMVGGMAADRLNRKRMLLVTQAILMGVAAALAVASYFGFAKPGVLIALQAAQGVTAAFNFAAWQVLVPRLVPREDLPRAIALNGVQFNLARIVGPALAGVIMARWGPTWLFVINTASFLGVLTAVAMTPDAPALEARPRDMSGDRSILGSLVHEMREPVRFVFHSRGPRAVFLGMIVFSLFGTSILRMLSLFVHDVYQRNEGVFGTMLGVMGAGAVIGGFLLKLIPAWYPKHHFIPMAITGGAIATLLFSAASSLVWGIVWLFFVGVFWLWGFTSAAAAMQMLVDDRVRGRVMAIYNTAMFGAMALGSIVAGAIGEHVPRAWAAAHPGIGVQIGVGSLSVILIGAGIAMLIWRTPEIDGMERVKRGRGRVSLIEGVTASAHRPARVEAAGKGGDFV